MNPHFPDQLERSCTPEPGPSDAIFFCGDTGLPSIETGILLSMGTSRPEDALCHEPIRKVYVTFPLGYLSSGNLCVERQGEMCQQFPCKVDIVESGGR